MKKVILSISMLTMILVACTKDEESEEFFLTFHNGETINVNVPPSLDGFSSVDSVEFYWDKTYIATEYDMPFTHKILLKNEKPGNHRCDIYIYNSENGVRYLYKRYCTYTIK